MFKSKIAAYILAVIMCILPLAAAGCSTATLDIPTGLEIDEDYRLSWESVEKARGYIIEIVDAAGAKTENSSRRAYISLSYLEEGDYEIRVKATADGKNYQDSSWTEKVYFHKDYENGCIYTLINNNSEYEISKMGAAGEEIIFEDLYRGKPVTAVGEGAFRGSKALKKVQLGKYVKTIGKGAFYSCSNLTEIIFPASLTSIGESAFQACGALLSVTFPENLKSIGESAFSYCHSFTEINLDGIQSIGSYAFTNCENITELVIPDSITSFGNSTFSSMPGLKSVQLSSTLENMPESMFRYCQSLEEIKFAGGGKLKSIGVNAFSGCTSLKSVVLPDGLQTIGYASFSYDTALESVTIPDTVTQVGAYALYNTKVYNDAISNGDDLIYVDNWLVGITHGLEDSGCANVRLTEITFSEDYSDDETYKVTIKEGTVGIANWTFMNCDKLNSVELISSVKYVGDYAFANCENLLIFRTATNGVKNIGMRAFYKSPRLEQLYLGEGLEVIEQEAFRETAVANPNNNRNIIPSTVKKIGWLAFYESKLWNNPDDYGLIYAGNWIVGNESLSTYVHTQEGDYDDDIFSAWSPNKVYVKKEVVISNPYYDENTDEPGANRVNISDFAFMLAIYLTNVEGMQNVSCIGKGAFHSCQSLTDVYISSNITEIEDYAFYGCKSLTQVILPNDLTRIGRSAFYDCEQLRSIMNRRVQGGSAGLNLNRSRVTDIGDFAFKGTGIASADLGDTVSNVGSAAFYKCKYLKNVIMSDEVSQISYGMFEGCVNLSEVDLGASVTTIGARAFNGCTSLKEINLPDTVENIGEYAFNESGLESIKAGSNLKTIGEYAFASSCLRGITLPSTVETVGDFAFENCSELTSVTIPAGIREIGKHAFLGCRNTSLFLESTSVPDGWAAAWNSQFCPEVWGCVLSDGKDYVASVTVGEGTIQYVASAGNYAAQLNTPSREGYVFLGWSSEEGATEAQYTAVELATLPAGTKVYSVWSAITD